MEAEPVGENPEETGNYHMFKLDGKIVGGCGAAMQNMPDVWNVYIAVEDADATKDAVESAGGKAIVDPFDVFTAGRLGVFSDPANAFFCVWQPGDNKGSEIVNALLKKKPDAAWTEEFPEAHDFGEHQSYVTPPMETPGVYVVLASVKDPP